MKAWRGNDLSRDARASPMEGPDMAEQKKKETRPTKPNEGGGDGASASPEIAKKGKKIKEDIDKLLDEIDHPRGERRRVREELRAARRRVTGADLRVPVSRLRGRFREVRARSLDEGRLPDVPER